MTHNNSPLISVVVPVYNSEKYLHRCIDSILSQTYRNLEVLLIDDESPDNSGKICDEYAEKDQRVAVIHQKNIGTGPTRAKGVEVAHGDYIAFVDNDDYILPEMYETMLKAIIENGADVCACQWNYECIIEGKPVHTWDTTGKERLYGLHSSSLEFAHYLYNEGSYMNGMVCSIWNKLFKRDLLLGIHLDNGRGEEEEMNDYAYCKDISVIVIPDEFYYWCDNSSSVTHWKFGENMVHFLRVLERRMKYYQMDDYLVAETEKLYCNLFIEYFYKASSVQLSMNRAYRKSFIKFYINLLLKFYCDIKWYMRVATFIISPTIYQKYTGIHY